jgi:hypothetical protein
MNNAIELRVQARLATASELNTAGPPGNGNLSGHPLRCFQRHEFQTLGLFPVANAVDAAEVAAEVAAQNNLDLNAVRGILNILRSIAI